VVASSPPIWRSVISVDSLVECGRAGVPVMMSRVANARIAERLARYREGLEAGGHDVATQRRRLAEAAADLLRDPPRRAAMGRAGRERADRLFARSRMIAEIADLYREAAGFPRGRP